MSDQMVEDLREYAWSHRQSISEVVRDVMHALDTDPLVYQGYEVTLPPKTKVLTVYVTDDLWEPVRDKMYWEGETLSAAIRSGVACLLDAERKTPTHT